MGSTIANMVGSSEEVLVAWKMGNMAGESVEELTRPLPTVFLIGTNDAGWGDVPRLLRSVPLARIVGQASHESEALRATPRLAPEVLISVPTIEGTSTLELLIKLRARSPASAIIVLTGCFDAKAVSILAGLGRASYLICDGLYADALCHSLSAMLAGAAMIDTRAVADALLEQPWHRAVPSPAAEQLSAREREVLQLIVVGTSEKEIATSLGLSPSSVQTYVERLRTKLGAKNRPHLVAIAVHQGLASVT